MLRGKVFFKKAADFIAAEKKKIALWGMGFSGYHLFDYVFDYGIYSVVIWNLGPIKGGVLIIILSLIYNLLALRFYNWSKKDWLGLETLKQIREYNGNFLIWQWLAWIMKKSSFLTLLFMAVKYNAFMVTVYMRNSNEYGELNKRDWGIFLFSLIVGEVYWILVVSGGITLIEYFYFL